jgi:hypothetical protein
MTGTTFITFITGENRNVYCSECFKAVSARPSGKSSLEKKDNMLGSDQGRVVGSELLGVCNTGQKLSSWAAFNV